MADWFYVAAGESESTGPVAEASLKQMFDDGTLVSIDTQVWQPGMGDWLLAHDIAVFAPPAPVEQPPPQPAPNPLDFVITPVIPQAQQPPAASAPMTIVKPTFVVPIKPPAPVGPPPETEESHDPSALLFTPVKTTAFGTPTKSIIHSSTMGSPAPKTPPPPSLHNLPPAPQSPVVFPPLPSPALTPPVASSAPMHAPPPPSAGTIESGAAASSRPSRRIPLWSKIGGSTLLLFVVLTILLWSRIMAAIDFSHGKTAEDQKNYIEAEREYQAALVHTPNSVAILTRLGVVSMRLGDAKISDWAIQRLQEVGAKDGTQGNAVARLEVLNTPEGTPPK